MLVSTFYNYVDSEAVMGLVVVLVGLACGCQECILAE